MKSSDKAVRPPLGLMPEWLHKEHRMKDIEESIKRYHRANYAIPKEWLNEKEQILKWRNDYLGVPKIKEPEQKVEEPNCCAFCGKPTRFDDEMFCKEACENDYWATTKPKTTRQAIRFDTAPNGDRYVAE